AAARPSRGRGLPSDQLNRSLIVSIRMAGPFAWMSRPSRSTKTTPADNRSRTSPSAPSASPYISLMRPAIRSASDISAPSRSGSYALRESGASPKPSRPAASADLDAPIVGTSRIGCIALHRSSEAITLRLELCGRHAEAADQCLAYCFSPAGREVEVVFGRSDVVRVALYGEVPFRVLRDERREAL